MAYKFTYLTIQHSGTRFLAEYFDRLNFTGLQETRMAIRGNKPIPPPSEIEYDWQHYGRVPGADMPLVRPGYPLLSTLRHPMKTAMSFAARGYDLRKCLDMWESFIFMSTQKPIIMFDIDCPPDKRVSHLLNTIKLLGVYKDEYEELTMKYALDWAPVGEYWRPANAHYTKNYKRNGTLPDVFNWDRFNRAATWYNGQLEKCEY